MIGEKYTYDVPEYGFPVPDWCPLKPVPEKKKIDEYFYPNFDYAWNACIDEILKGDNDE